VIPYVFDQLAMARLARATFALLLAIFPAVATLIGFIFLRQRPTVIEVIGNLLVMCGIAAHKEGTT
jgi:inner membrane transporter RhtA